MKPSRPGEPSSWLWALGFVGLSVAIYWQVLAAPYIQADWRILWRASRPLLHALRPFQPDFVLYRPFVRYYFRALYGAFGDQALPAHAIALVLHGVSGWLLSRVVARWLDDLWLGRAVGVAYVAAAAVHFDALLWVAGIQDLAAVACVWGALWAFLNGRGRVSALLFALALGWKEAAITTPMLLAAVEWSRGEAPRAVLRRLPWHAGILLVYLGVRLFGPLPTALSSDDPYYVALLGPHVWSNTLAYLRWSCEGVAPWVGAFWVGQVVVAVVAVFGLRGLAARVRIALVVWAVGGILPVLFLPNHTYRYYLVYSLPAVLIPCWAALVRVSRYVGAGALVVVTVGGALFFWRANRSEGPLDGANNLPARARWVQRVKPVLQSAAVDRGACLVFEGIDAASFGGVDGPRLWLGDATLTMAGSIGAASRPALVVRGVGEQIVLEWYR